MEILLKPEIYIPIVLNLILAITTIVLAITTIGYLIETRSLRKGMMHQLEIARRQHFVTTAPFLFAGELSGIVDTNDFRLTIINPSEKLARDVKYIVYESSKKTFRAPDKSQVIVKPNDKVIVTILAEPYTKLEVEDKIKSFYEIVDLDKGVITEGDKSYVLLLYTDVEGSVYSVKSHLAWKKEENKFTRGRSRFKKLYDPRS